MAFDKPKVTIDLEEYQSLLKIKEDGHDSAALELIKQLHEEQTNQLINQYGWRTFFRKALEQFDVKVEEDKKSERFVITKISHKQ